MEECGLKNFKINIVLYKYADKRLQDRFMLRKTYKNWIKFCAIKDSKVADEDSIVKFLLHERLLEESEEGIRITPQGRVVLSTEVFMTEYRKSLFTSLSFWISFFAFVLSVLAIMKSFEV